MPEPAEVLARECAALCRHLTGAEPSRRVIEKYLAAHALGVVELAGDTRAFDRFLVRCARSGRALARLADGHARIFRPAGLLRRKLVLLLALVECGPEAGALVDTPTRGGPNGFVFGALLRLAWFAVLLALGALLFFPARALCAFGDGGRA